MVYCIYHDYDEARNTYDQEVITRFHFVRIISKINLAVAAISKIIGMSAMNIYRKNNSVKCTRGSIASDWRNIGKDMERGLTQYDRGLTSQSWRLK